MVVDGGAQPAQSVMQRAELGAAKPPRQLDVAAESGLGQLRKRGLAALVEHQMRRAPVIGVGLECRPPFVHELIGDTLNVLATDAEAPRDLRHRQRSHRSRAHHLPTRLGLPYPRRDLFAPGAKPAGQFEDVRQDQRDQSRPRFTIHDYWMPY